MNPEPEFLTVEDVLQIHDEQLAAYGGAAGIRDQALLESAVAMPQASFGEAYLHEDSLVDTMSISIAETCRYPSLFLLIDGFPRRQIMRHQAPRSTGSYDPTQAVDDFAQRVRALWAPSLIKVK